MGLRIKTNIESIIGQRRLTESRRQMTDSLEKLSSGQRINKASDDAAGLAVSESIRAKTRSLDVAKRNASDGVSYVQVAEGGLNEITNNIVRMRELTSQAASDTVGQRERSFLDKEFQQLRQEVNRVISVTEFNGSKVLDAADNDRPIQIFIGASDRGSDYMGNTREIDPDNDPDILSIDLSDLTALNESFEPFREEGSMALTPDDPEGGAQDLGPDGTNAIFESLDNSLSAVSAYRATLGSFQSRLGSAITNIEVANENLLAAQSRIRDVDYASETAKFTQSRILTTAGTSVLAQANQTPELALSLLR
jgi:flagellin